MPDLADHLDVLALDAIRAGESPAPEAATHLAGCATCRAELEALNGLASVLKAEHAAAVDTASARDAQIHWLAQAHAQRVRRSLRPSRRRWIATPATWALAATALLAVASVLLLSRREAPRPHQELVQVAPAPPIRAGGPIDVRMADRDGDGRVTVLDAFALARALKNNDRAGAVDLTHDARADDDDVNALLAIAVSVKGG